MPWKETTVVTERSRMILKWKSQVYSVTELAEEFGVSRVTVYEWIKREKELGVDGLVDRSRAPKNCPKRTSPEIAEKIIREKHDRPHWGPEKLIRVLKKKEPDEAWPAASTAGGILDRNGLVRHRPKRRTGVIRNARVLTASESGEMMTVDHKGQFRMGNRMYCFPLTIADPVSRYIYAIHGSKSTADEPARKGFEKVFREHGIPDFIGSDNGVPFCSSTGLAGLSTLSVWWVTLGITPVRIHPGCPWENGVHERMHRTLKGETAKPPSANMRSQQARFDEFRDEFNHERPHEGINGQRPADLLRPCRREYPRRLPEIQYPGYYEVRTVRTSGEICWQGGFLFIGRALRGQRIGLVEVEDGVWGLHFSTIELGRYDMRTKQVI